MASNSFVGKKFTIYRPKDGVTSVEEGTLRELGPKEILVRITHTGICHTDTVLCRIGAPLALGHEGVGVVEAVGSLVTQFKVGERAGGGFHRDACGYCRYCLAGEDIWCYDRVVFGEGDWNNGTFSEYYIGKEGFLHRIPDGLASEHAAPLQCAGATVYSALKATADPSKRVGILGIGGLGHLAIQYAAKMGAEVVVYSTSADKEDEAKGFGAKEFYLLSDMVEKQSKPVDVLVVAGTRYPDWSK
jgi:D-arabinose 1-dehydrogenase-like Zn-dependent alcohol dehydrogenase